MEFRKDFATKGTQFGLLFNWQYKGTYLFYDLETKKRYELKNLDDVQILGDDEKYIIFEARNYRTPKPGEKFSERQKMYGKIHDNFLDITSNGTNGKYSMNFIRGAATIISEYHLFKETMPIYGNDADEIFEKINKDGRQMEFVGKYLIGPVCEYDILCHKFGLLVSNTDPIPDIPENELLDIFREIQNWPESIKNKLMNSVTMYLVSDEMNDIIKKI